MNTKRKIITDRKPMNDDEILSKRKDFNSLREEFLNNKKSSVRNLKKISWAMGIAAGISLIFIISYLNKVNQNAGEVNSSKIITDTSFFKKPLPELIAYQIFVIDSKKDIELTSRKGSRIHIKANTFVDKNGKTIEGNVEVIYNEYHNPVELFLSGIPMKYDSAGFNYTFESAGMFEIYAKKDNEFLAMNENNPINIDLVSDQNEPFNLYYYDTKENEWSFLNNENKADIKVNTTNNEIDNKVVSKSDDYVIMPKEEKINTEIAQPKDEVFIRKANPDNYSFSIDIKEDEFPELAQFKNLLFEIEKSDSGFLEEYYDVKWTKILLSKTLDNGYFIELSRFKKTVKFKAYPVLNASDYEKNIADYNKKTSEMAKKQDDNMKNISSKASKIKEIETQKEMINNFQYYRNLSITNLGTYNCDRPLPMPEFPLQISFNFTDKEGNVLKYNEINIVQKNRNILWKYSINNKTFISKALNNVAWFITPTNQMAIVEIEGNCNITIKPNQTVDLHTIRDGIEKLKIILGNT